jgi:uncharacterized protein (DUF1015 family)
MVFLANMDDTGLQVFPTHRLLKAFPEGMTAQTFREALSQSFDEVPLTQFESDEQTLIASFPTDSGTPETLCLKLRDNNLLADTPELMRSLDVVSLDQLVVEKLYGMSASDLKAKGVLWFDRDTANVDRLMAQPVHQGEMKVAFYVHAPSVHQVKAICESGHLMPQKSTYFYPKILSGTVFYHHSTFGNGPDHALSGVSGVPAIEPLPKDLFQPTPLAQ